MKKSTFTFLFFVIYTTVFSQVSGNQAFSGSDNGYNNNYKDIASRQIRLNKLYLNDSAFLIEAKILKNVKADNYVAVFGISREAKTVNGCNTLLNDRIRSFISGLKKIGVKDADIYTDLITQTRIFDFKKDNDTYEEYCKGFELSKNIIISYQKPEQIEQFLTLASLDSIFDLVKVDYIITDISKVYDELFATAKEIISKKKQMYIELTDAKLTRSSQMYAENFASYYPSDLYKNYKAYAQNEYENYNWLDDKEIKRLHKYQTYYYDKIDYSNFDTVINPIILEPSIQVILTLQVKYNIIK